MFEAATDCAAKLAFLRKPASSYGDEVESVQCIETHMSWLFLTEAWVFKLKKPVVFAFLDFSTLAARALYCREEVRLNARLAPGVYLGVWALQRDGGHYALVPEAQALTSGNTVDWLVQMRRLPADRALHHCIAAGGVGTAELDGLMALLAAFYRAAPVVAQSGSDYRVRLHGEWAKNRDLLLCPQFHLPNAALVLQRFAGVLVAACAQKIQTPRCRSSLHQSRPAAW